MKISIITATYNSSATIARCLASVNEQSHIDIEHIIIDGASKDNTLEIINSSPNRVRKIISEPDNGIYDALNKGIKLATGDAIGFLHSDDTLGSPTTLENIAKLFKTKQKGNVTPDGVHGNLLFTDKQDAVVRTWYGKPFERKNVKYGWMPSHPTLFLKREVYEKLGGFDTSFRIAGDYNFMLKVMLDEEISLEFLPEIITRMRVGGASTGNSKSLIHKSKKDIRALRNNGFRFPYVVVSIKMLRKLPQLLKK